jgi:hypothetical protein
VAGTRWLGLVAGVAVACDDNSPALPGASEELWMLQTRVFTDTDTFGYAVAVPELTGEIDNRASIEQGGGGMIYAPPTHSGSWFLLSEAEQPLLTRHRVTEANAFRPGATLSFGDYGVTSGYGVVAWVDDHQAYWVDGGERQIIRFDPTDMVIESATPIEGTERPGFVTEFSGYPLVRSDGIWFTVRWRKDWEDEPVAPAGAMLVHVDPATDAVTVTEDPRCTSLLVSHTTPDGDTYWFSDNYNTYARVLGGADHGVPDCVLRVRAGERTFDPDWSLDLSTRTGGLPADGVVGAGGSSIVWLSVYDEGLLDRAPRNIDELDPAPAWRWFALDLESDAPAAPASMPAGSHGAFGWVTDGRSFSSTVNADYSESTLLEVTPDGFEQLAVVDGLLDAIVRVR